ncbi:hypothetical protein O1611_g10205 [Lasiodiplodia mahajangana]|uniref:Uncharacterized protein n=1 Tax=Lasiodiplodia mahajangana TaxID=1108764 RepID=A0ACC2J0Y2_9PEZI|nr:hypothetical protein O1611_g10205 [Lasiodiplodia mahajangana]
MAFIGDQTQTDDQEAAIVLFSAGPDDALVANPDMKSSRGIPTLTPSALVVGQEVLRAIIDVLVAPGGLHEQSLRARHGHGHGGLRLLRRDGAAPERGQHPPQPVLRGPYAGEEDLGTTVERHEG